jgi:hypothetical protein
MAAGGCSWQAVAALLIQNLLVISSGEVVPASSSLCKPASAAEAVEAGMVPVLLACLAFSSAMPNDELVQQVAAAAALGMLAAALYPSSPVGCSRQLPEPMRGALRPAVAALAGLLRSTQLPSVAITMMGALADIAVVDEALAVEAAAAGAAQLAAQWSRRTGAAEEVVQAAEGLLEKLAFQGDTVPADIATASPELPGSSCVESAGPGQGGSSQATGCAACGAANRPDRKALQMCSACLGMSYCSRVCQRRHWGEHKGACRRVG